jgi:sugar phosphate isomerase/epimerase
MTWQIGASTGCCQQTPIVEVIEALASIGVPAIEIGTPPGHFDIWQRAQVEAIKQQLERCGVNAIAIHAPFGGLLDLSDPNPHHRNAGMAAIMTAAAILQELRGRIVVIHATDVVQSVADAATRLRHACESVHALQRACRELGMTLAIETPLGHLIGGRPGDFARLLQAAGADARVCLDTGHTWLAQQWDAFVDLARGRLVHVHAHDNGGVFDDHRPPGDGDIDWARVARSLAATHFDGWLMLELACPTEPLPHYFARSERQLRALLA